MVNSYKIILYGTYNIGKTSLVHRLLRDEFYNFSQSTIGASYSTWTYNKPNTKDIIRFGLWDTAGQEKYSTLLPIYLRGTHAVIYCWEYLTPFNKDVANKMYNNAIDHSPDCQFYLVITKIDRAESNKIFWEEAEEWVLEKDNIKGCFYTSAYNGYGINDLFNKIAENLISCPIINKDTFTLDIENLGKPSNCC